MTYFSIDIIAGARPNFMKIAPIIRAINNSQNNCLKYRLVHTGQHYDDKMSGDFFTQLGIPEPDINLEIGSGSQAQQTAAIMTRYEDLLMEEPCDLCLVVGDVTSTMACAITSQKLHIPVAHVEAGIRSGDWSMPEEINRMVTDSITNFFFTTSESANNFLRKSVSEEKIFFVGNTMIDTLLYNMENLRAPSFWNEHQLKSKQYIILTLHRPDNVDDHVSFENVLRHIAKATRNFDVIFPVHPRTKKTLSNLSSLPSNIIFVDPQPYLEFNFLVKNAKAVITDSGGITEECTVMGIPCLTLRDTTERPETITIGTNVLIGTNPTNIKPALDMLFDGEWKSGSIPEKWDGNTGQRIVSILESKFCKTN